MNFRVHIALAICAVLLALTLLAYWPALDSGFVTLDDDYYILDNPQVRAGLTVDGLKWAFTTFEQGNWHPLTWLLHMLDVQLYGVNPAGHHLTSVLLHMANVLLLFFVVWKLTDRMWPSSIVAGLFAVHPLHVESVAWVSEHKDVLSTFFWLLTVLAYLSYVRRGGVGRYAVVLLTYALGLMAKPMLVSLPLILLILDYWPLGRLQGSGVSNVPDTRRPTPVTLLLEKIPLFAMAAACCALVCFIHSRQPDISRIGHLPLSLRIDNAIVSYVVYLQKMLWPVRLAIQYPHPLRSIPALQLAACALILIAISAVAVSCRKRRPYVTAGWLWYLVMLLPVIGLVQTGEQAMADRYTYLPLVGVFIAIVWWAFDRKRSVRTTRALALAAAIAIGALTICANVQTRVWHDSVSLLTHALRVTRGNYVAHLNLGVALERKGDREGAKRQYRAALRLQPEYPRGLYNLGVLLQRDGNLDQAARLYTKTLRVFPGFVDAQYNLGLVYDLQKRPAEAIKCYEAALKLAPGYAQARNNLAIVFYENGRYSEAWKQVHALRKMGLSPHPGFVRALSDKMPDPKP